MQKQPTYPVFSRTNGFISVRMARARVQSKARDLSLKKMLAKRICVIPSTPRKYQIPSGRSNWRERRNILKFLFKEHKHDCRALIKKENPKINHGPIQDPSIPGDVITCVNDILDGVDILHQEPANFYWTHSQNSSQHTKLTRNNFFELKRYAE